MSDSPTSIEPEPTPTADRFGELCASGHDHDVDLFLAAAGELSAAETAAVLRVDQRHRWRRGERVPAEDYLARHPGLTEDPDAALDLIFNEYLTREQCGEPPEADTFVSRFPDYAEVLRAQIDLHQAIVVDDADAAAESGWSFPPHAATGEIPGYEIVRQIGCGGMGVIYEARQHGLNRRVALKMISAGAYASADERARFKTEAEAAARLRHPNIVQIYEVGSVRGMPFLALEYVDGGTLAQSLAGRPLPPRQAGALVELLARAIHYAHSCEVVHRDLKPANILLARNSPTTATTSQSDWDLEIGEWTMSPKVSDFGLAKDLSGGDDQTATGAIVGTPGYMAPEQADGRAKHAGPAADIYALGAILYEALTGRPPFRGATALETLLQVRTLDPPAPDRLVTGLPRDLASISLKALAKEPARRYPTAADLADDLRRFLARMPVRARPVSFWERRWRSCRRNPWLAGSAAAALLFLFVAVVVGGVAALVTRERNVAVDARDRAVVERERAERAEREKEIGAHIARAAAARRDGPPRQRIRSLDELRAALALGPSADQRQEIRDEAVAALVLPDAEVAAEWEGWPEGTVAVAFDDDFRRYARLTADGTVTLHIRSGNSAVEVGRFSASAHRLDGYLSLSPDGRFVVVGHPADAPAGGAPISVWALDWDARGLAPRRALTVPTAGAAATVIAFRQDGRRLAIGSGQDGALTVLDPETGSTCLTSRFQSPIGSLAFQPGGDLLAVGQGNEIVLLDLGTDAVRTRVRPRDPSVGAVLRCAWHPDGTRIAAACVDGRIHVWEAMTGAEVMAPWERHTQDGIQVAFNATGDLFASYDWSLETRLWDAATGRWLFSLPIVGGPHFSRSGNLLGPQRVDTRLRLWRMSAGRGYRALRPALGSDIPLVQRPVPGVEGRIVAATWERGLCFFDLETGAELATADLHRNIGLRGYLDREGWLMTSASPPAGTILWPARRDPRIPGAVRVGPPRYFDATECPAAAATPDGKLVAMSHWDHTMIANRSAEIERRYTLGAQYDIRSVAVSTDGRWVATASWNTEPGRPSVQVWHGRTGKLACDLPLTQGLGTVSFSPDGHWLLTSLFGADCRVWEVGSWRQFHQFGEASVCFSADGRLMAVGDIAGQVRLLEPKTGREIGRLTGPDPIRYDPSCFSADGTRLIAVGRDRRALHVWDMRTIREKLSALGLDWDLPPFPTVPPTGPLRVEVDRGFWGHQADFPDPRGAAALFTMALAFQPLNPEAYYHRGRAFGRIPLHHEAIADYTAFLTLSSPTDGRRGEILLRRSENYRLLGDRDAASRDLLAMTALDLSDIFWPSLVAAKFRIASGRSALTGGPDGTDLALRFARKALQLQPADAFSAALVQYRLGHWDEVARILESHASRDTDLGPRDYYLLASCHAHLGNTAEARECVRRGANIQEKAGGDPREEDRAERDTYRAEAELTVRLTR